MENEESGCSGDQVFAFHAAFSIPHSAFELHPQLEAHPVDEAVGPNPGPRLLADFDAGLADHAGAPVGVDGVEGAVDAEGVRTLLDVAHRDDAFDGKAELLTRQAARRELAAAADLDPLHVA